MELGIGLISLIFSVVTAGIGFVVWLVRLEGRHNVADTKFTAMEKRIDGLEEQILARLQRIEEILLERGPGR